MAKMDGYTTVGSEGPQGPQGPQAWCRWTDGADGAPGADGIDGQDGSDGFDSVVNTYSIYPGIDCEDGGIMLETGTDLNGNGILDTNEVTSSEIICNGIGRDSIASTYSIPPGIDCEDGGIMLEIGTDLNGNGMLDYNEITSSEIICNGDGRDSITASYSIPPGIDCEDGGIMLETGTDLNGNGILDTNEVTSSEIICNGDGRDSIANTLLHPTRHRLRRWRHNVETGTDLDGNGMLDYNEITSSEIICNGEARDSVASTYSIHPV